jgi:hypothetical protein
MKTPPVPQRRGDPISAERFGEAGPSDFPQSEYAEDSDNSARKKRGRDGGLQSSVPFSTRALPHSSHTRGHGARRSLSRRMETPSPFKCGSEMSVEADDMGMEMQTEGVEFDVKIHQEVCWR